MIYCACGYCGTGSSVVYHLLSEYDGIESGDLGDYEHVILYTPNGLFDLEDHVLRNNGWHNFDDEYGLFSRRFVRDDDTACGDDPLIMFFTSGTTGYPKIAVHSHKYPLGHFITAKYWHCVERDGIHFTISETGWGKALWGKLYGQWLCEAGIFTYDFDRFHSDDILPLFKKYNITTFCAPPTMYRFFIKEDLSKYDLSSIEYAPFPAATIFSFILFKTSFNCPNAVSDVSK